VRLEIISGSDDAARIAQRSLGIRVDESGKFELLRATVWAIAGPVGKAHVNRILATALPAWRAFSPRVNASQESLRAELRESMSALEIAGDLLDLGGGYWAPATARLIRLPESYGNLVVGGAPSTWLFEEPNDVRLHGAYRHLRKVPVDLERAIPTETFTEWARLPDSRIQDWARETVQSLEPQAYVPVSGDAFEFYLPSTSRTGTPQFKRWAESAGVETGTLLARRKRLFGVREYRLVQVRSGRPVSVCETHNIDVRRLMYALDLEAKNPVRARRVCAGEVSTWRLTSELPRAEQRVLGAFGELTIPDDRPFERCWTFHHGDSIAFDMLESLGIVVEQQG
jgi:hypothetical protein